MGVRYSAQLVCGFRVYIEPNMVEKTKYDENTGERYKIDIVKDYDITCEDNVLEKIDSHYPVGETIEGLEIYASGYEEPEVYILGRAMGNVDEYCEAAELDMEIPPEIKDFAKKYKKEIQWHLLFNVS